MKYEGKLYGKVGGKYIELEPEDYETTSAIFPEQPNNENGWDHEWGYLKKLQSVSSTWRFDDIPLDHIDDILTAIEKVGIKAWFPINKEKK